MNMFGLLGKQRKAAVRAAVEGLLPIIATVQDTHGLPREFWTDEYVLGFISFSISFRAKLATNGKIAGENLRYASLETLTALSNMDGAELLRRMTTLATEGNIDFKRGADDAAAVQLYSRGILTNHPLAQRAAAAIAGTGMVKGMGRRYQIAGMMVVLSFVHEVKKRFDLQ
jgi:hypothetical protein